METIITEEKEAEDSFFLPNFCESQTVFMVILAGELLALLLTLSGSHAFDKNLFHTLGLISLMIQWVALSSAAILCFLRQFLRQWSVQVASLFACLCIVFITVSYTTSALIVFYKASILNLSEYQITLIVENGLISAIVAIVTLRYFHLQQKYRLRLSMEAEARIQALQSRIHPHFLFNSMNIIASLTQTNPELAEEVVQDLSELFRASLNKAGKLVTLEEEITLCQRYGNIEKLRLGDRLTILWQIELDPSKFQIPLLTIQPLLENAIYHGIEPLTEGGTIKVVIEQQHKKIQITIANPLSANSNNKTSGNQIALKNIQERLLVLFGERAKLEMHYSQDMYIVSVILPSGEGI